MSRARGRPVPPAAWAALAAILACLFRVYPAAAQAPAEPPAEPTIHLQGKVLGPDGAAVPGAQVGAIDVTRIDPTKENPSLDDLFTAKCNEAGEFDLVTRDVSQWWGPQAAYCVVARTGDGKLAGAAAIAGPDAGKPVEVRLQASGYIHTSVVSPQGRPLPGIRTMVRYGNLPGSVPGPQTNEQGEARIGPLPAGLKLGIGVAYELRHLVPRNTWDRVAITLKPGETQELAPLTLDPEGRTVEGTLQDADGKPLPGAQVACHLPSWPANLAVADAQGHFRLSRLPVQGHDVWLIAADTARKLYLMSLVDPDSGQKVRLVLRSPTSAGGFLSSQDGQVLADVGVHLMPVVKTRMPGGTGHVMWNIPFVPAPGPVKTGPDGSWRAEGLVAGAMYALSSNDPRVSFDFQRTLFEVDRDGKPMDLGLIVAQ